MNRQFSRLLWLPTVTDEPVTVGELLSTVATVAVGLAAITAVWHVMGAVIRAWFA